MTLEKGAKYEQFDTLIRRYRKLIRSFCWRYSSGSDTLCEELVQDCYISIWFHISSLRPDVHLLQQTAWVVWQCRSVFSHRLRRKEPNWLPLDEQIADSTPAPDDYSKRELIIELASDLSDNEHHVLTLILEGYPRNEIAERMSTTPENVKKIRERIILKMQQTQQNANNKR